MVSNCRGIQLWDRYGLWNKSAGLYSSFSPPVAPQANGREWVLEVGKFSGLLNLSPCHFLCTVCDFSSCPQQAHTSLVNPVQPSMQQGTSLSVTSDYRIRDRFNLCTIARKVPLVQ